MIRKVLVIGVLLLALPTLALALPSPTWYYLVDTTSVNAGSTYSLTITPLSQSGGVTTYRAELQADTVNAAYFINWFQIKLDGGEAALITAVNAYPTSTNWLAMQGGANINLAGFGNELFATGTWSGLYLNGAVEGATLSDLHNGAPLDGSTHVWEYVFDLANPLNPNPSLQVGFYGGYAGNSTNIKTDRLSQDFHVPEPSTLLLFGTALVGLGLLGRRRFRS